MAIKKTLSVLIGSLILSAGAASVSAENYYFGAQFAQTTYEQSGTSANPSADDGEADPNAIILIGGYNFSENIALEGRLGFDGGDDDFNFNSGGSIGIEVDQLVSILAKFSLGSSVSPYLLVGFSDIELESAGGQVVEGDGVSFGVGVDFSVSENTAIALEYVQYADFDISGGGDAEFSAVSLGVNFGF